VRVEAFTTIQKTAWYRNPRTRTALRREALRLEGAFLVMEPSRYACTEDWQDAETVVLGKAKGLPCAFCLSTDVFFSNLLDTTAAPSGSYLVVRITTNPTVPQSIPLPRR
jgi:hypothetical protein